MSNSQRWYATRESVKGALGIGGADLDALIDGYIEAASENVEKLCADRRFIPYTATKQYPWPQAGGRSYCLALGEDLIAATALTKNDDDVTAIAAADYLVEPVNEGPPYNRIEIDLSSSEFFSWANTPQRAVRVTGRWGYGEDTKPAGALAEADDGTETALDVTDASLVGVGDTILIGTEQMFVSGRSALTTTATLSGNPTAADNDVTIGVSTGSLVKTGEVILVDSERMLVTDVIGNNLTVKRAYDGSILAAHSAAAVVYAYRTLTVARSVNGTTAAAHNTATAITKFAPPAPVVELCRAYAIYAHQQDRSGWTGQIGGGEGAVIVARSAVRDLEKDVKAKYRRWWA